MGIGTDPLRIGAGANGSGLYDGDLDGVRIYSRALSADDASTLYTDGRGAVSDAISTVGLEAFYPCEGIWIGLETASAGVETYTDLTCFAQTAYKYRVNAYNADGESDYSNVAAVRTAPPGPAAPSGLSATALSVSSIKVDWTDNADDETGFTVERTSSSGPGVVSDTAGQGRNAALNPTVDGGPTWVADGNGGLFRFDGADDYADAGNVQAVEGVDALTVSVWINPDSVSSDAVLLSKGNLGLNTVWMLWQDAGASVSGRSRTITFGVSSGATKQFTRVEGSTDAAPAGEWTHVVAVWQRSPETVKLYINGELDQQDTDLKDVDMNTSTDPLRLGAAASGAGLYDGDLTGARIYGRVLSASDVATLYSWGRQAAADVISTTELEVFYGCDSSWMEFDLVGQDIATYTDLFALPDTSYTYRVKAYNAQGSSDYSDTATAQTPSGGGSPPPGGASEDYVVVATEVALPVLPVDIQTSGGLSPWTNGWAVLDGDEETLWIGDPKAAGWWIAMVYDPAIAFDGLYLLSPEGTLTNRMVLGSEDAEVWFDANEVIESGEAIPLNYLWIIFPADDTGVYPQIQEIQVEAQGAE